MQGKRRYHTYLLCRVTITLNTWVHCWNTTSKALLMQSHRLLYCSVLSGHILEEMQMNRKDWKVDKFFIFLSKINLAIKIQSKEQLEPVKTPCAGSWWSQTYPNMFPLTWEWAGPLWRSAPVFLYQIPILWLLEQIGLCWAVHRMEEGGGRAVWSYRRISGWRRLEREVDWVWEGNLIDSICAHWILIPTLGSPRPTWTTWNCTS